MVESFSSALEHLIDKECLNVIRDALQEFVEDNPEQINASSKLVEDPSNAALIDFEVKTIRNATIDDDRITFDVIVICDIEVEETIHRNREVDSICQWFIIKCQAMLSETLDEFNVQEIRTY